MSVLSNLTLDDLRYLVAFADAGSVVRAADSLGVKQPAVSRRMDVWRDSRRPLTHKKGNRDVLTTEGEQVAHAARAIIRQFEQLNDYLRLLEDEPNSLILAAGSTAAQWFLAPVIARASRDISNWQFRTRVLRGEKRIVGVAGGELDLAIVIHEPMQIDRAAAPVELAVQQLTTLPLCVACHKDTEAAKVLGQFALPHTEIGTGVLPISTRFE